MGKVIIFSAPSGSGKTTIVRELLKRFPQFEFSVSATSRAPRGCERHGCDYHFMTHEEFMRAVAENRFVEWEEVYQGTCYGTLRSEVERIWAKGNIIVFDVDVIGGINLKRIFGERRLLDIRHAALGRGAAPQARRPRHGRPGGDRPPRGEGRIRADESPRIRPHRRERLARRGDPPKRLRIIDQFIARPAMKRVMLYFGSFNPVHKGHIALAEYVVEQGLCDEAGARRLAPEPL